MKNQIEDYVSRPKTYANVDGTSEMGIGVMLLGFALYWLVQPHLEKYFIWANKFADILIMYAVIGLVVGLGYLGARAIKRHITYPRTGYVAYRRDAKSRAPVILLATAVGSAGLFLLIRFGERHNAINLSRLGMLSLLVASYAYFILRFSGEHRWKWLVVLFLALGSLAISFSGWDRPRFDLVMSLFFGFTWLVAGGITLYLYIRRTRPPGLEAE